MATTAAPYTLGMNGNALVRGPADRLLTLMDRTLRTLAAPARAQRPCPEPLAPSGPLSEAEAREIHPALFERLDSIEAEGEQ